MEEHTLPGSRKRPDGTLLDDFRIPRGYWEAKDTKDDLEAEIRSKIKLGYDLRNTIFEDTRRAVLYQNKDVPFSWRVVKMRLNKDKTAVVVNEALTLAGIPAAAFAYKLGNRSALEWVLDQYQVSTDKRSGIVTDPNRADDPEYIVRLVRKVMTVSVETMRLVACLPLLKSD